ncbi:hypothetical protein QUA43_04115 [Microcoleus sp. N9_B4]|uniref:hypothetical protein n=1 Tax=Microcoleus sp. N9_B4 TaxID=3055386 RepID=UPI002FD50C46
MEEYRNKSDYFPHGWVDKRAVLCWQKQLSLSGTSQNFEFHKYIFLIHPLTAKLNSQPRTYPDSKGDRP